jgi:hypothetical protein
VKLRAVVLTAVTALATAHAAQASNVVIDMSQVEDYTQYQTDLQQCEGLAVQNQPDAPQRESVAGTAVKGRQSARPLARSAANLGQRPPRKVQVSASLRRPAVIAGIGAKPVLMPARKLTKLSKTVWPGEATTF